MAASENTHVRCGVVDVVDLRGFTIFDYDPMIFDRTITYYHQFFPVKPVAVHLCCPTSIVARVVVPVVNALIDTWSRSCTRVHNVPPHDIVRTLLAYGIEKEMLPTIVGGTVELDASEWIAQRWAAEMEELS